MKSDFDVARYKWRRLAVLEDDAARSKHLDFLKSIDWAGVEAYASRLRAGRGCHIEEPIGLGGRHIIKVLTFDDGHRYVARFRLPSFNDLAKDEDDGEADALMLREIDCLKLVSNKTTVPVPDVLGYGKTEEGLGGSFILMDGLPGNVGMDMHFDHVPLQFKHNFFGQMANAQVQIYSLSFPRIGVPILLSDGTVQIGPIPGIGGPFDTASAYLRAWALTVRFPLTEEWVKTWCGTLGDEIWNSTLVFPRRISELADKICKDYEHGPFPLMHTDFGHNNIVVDDDYNILGVIDWEHAIVAPWETAEFPLTVNQTPRPMDVPEYYHPDGTPRDEDMIARCKEREQYVAAVKKAEEELSVASTLSTVLGNQQLQNVARAMTLFKAGKMGYYSRVLDEFEASLRS